MIVENSTNEIVYPPEDGFTRDSVFTNSLVIPLFDINAKKKVGVYSVSLNDKIVGYEVLVLRKVKVPDMFKIGNKYNGYTHRWSKPTTNEFGAYGWYYTDYKSAEDKVKSLLQQK